MKTSITTVMQLTLVGVGLLRCEPLLASSLKSEDSIPVELWVTGHDGLTLKFRASLEDAIEKSADFSEPATETKANSLVMTIPTSLYWQRAQGKVNFQYVVIFTDKNQKYLGASVHSCWDDEMNNCANLVLSEAKQAWFRRGPTK